MSTAIETKLTRCSKDTGIPKKELRRMCTAAGLELLEKGELTIRKKPARKSTK